MPPIKPTAFKKSKNVKKGDSVTKVKHNKSQSLKWDENIDSSDEEIDHTRDEESEDDEILESAEQIRKRLAKDYITSLSKNDDDSDRESDVDMDSYISGGTSLSERLRKERLDSQGKYFRDIADKMENLNKDQIELTSLNHNGILTCLALSTDENIIYSGSKDNSLTRWDIETGKKFKMRPNWNRSTHNDKQSSQGEVLAVAVCTDGKYVVTGGRDKMIRIYDTRTNSEIKSFPGHQDAVTSLSFRRDTHSLYSGSLDRCLKHWDLNEMGYIETMFGHQDQINALDCWTKERPITASNDRTCRVWKVADESHLVFRGHKGSVDCVQMIKDDTYLTGGQDGSLLLWKETQKKPVATINAAHGFENTINPRWITSLASVKMSDIAVSGSFDGSIRLWNVNSETKRMKEAINLPIEGFVNGLALTQRLIIAGTGSEHRLGRWWRLKGNKNRIIIMKVPELNGIEDNIIQDDNIKSDDDDEVSDSDDENN